MSQTTWALIIASVLALIGIGVAVLAVPNHPDRAKVAKVFFLFAALVFAATGFYWTVSTNQGFWRRCVIDSFGAFALVIGLAGSFRFADRSSLGDLSLPASAFIPEPLWPRNKKLSALIIIGTLLIVALINGLREPTVASWAKTIFLWDVPWQWIVPAFLSGLTLMGAVAVFRTRKKSSVLVSCQDERLHAVAENDKKQIASLVRVCAVYYKTQFTNETLQKYIDFTFFIFNNSLHEILISDSLPGYILFGSFGDRFSRACEIESKRITRCDPRADCRLTVRQYVDASEIKTITESENVHFWFEHLGATFKLAKDEQAVPIPLNTNRTCETKRGRWHVYDIPEYVFALDENQWKAAIKGKTVETVQEIAELKAERDALKTKLEELGPKLTFEVDGKATQVRISGGRDVRRIEAQVKLVCYKSSAGDMAIRDFQASFYKETPEGEQAIITGVKALRAWQLPNNNLDFSNGLIINQPISPIYWFFFYLDLPPQLDSALSLKHFLRITMTAIGQSPSSIDFYVNSWSEARQGNSYVTLKE